MQISDVHDLGDKLRLILLGHRWWLYHSCGTAVNNLFLDALK